jgi:tetratricopeptide (TPR) repeat protein
MSIERHERALDMPISRATRVRLLTQLAGRYEAAASGNPAHFQRSAGYYAQALELVEPGSRQYAGLAFYLAQCLVRCPSSEVADLTRARTLLMDCRAMFTAADRVDDAFAQQLLGNIALRMPGDHAANVEEAIDLLEQANATLEAEVSTAPARDRAIVLSQLAAAYEMRLEGDSAKNLKAAISTYLRAAGIYSPEEDAEEYYSALRNAAMLTHSSGDLVSVRSGIDLMQKVLSHDERAGSPLDVARDLGSLAALHFSACELGGEADLQHAIAFSHRALGIPEVSEDRYQRCALLTNLGAVFDKMAEPPADAEARLREAVALADSFETEFRIQATARYHLGRLLAKQHRADEALNVYDEAIGILESHTEPESSEASVVDLGRKAARLYESAIDALLAKKVDGAAASAVGPGLASAALDCLERNKARALTVALTSGNRDRPGRVPAELWQEYEALRARKRLLATRAQVNRRRRAPQSLQLQDVRAAGHAVDHVIDLAQFETMRIDAELAQISVREVNLRAAIHAVAPDFPVTQDWPRNAAEKAGRLTRPGRALVEFVTTDKATYTFAVSASPGGVRIQVLSSPLLNGKALGDFVERAWREPYGSYRAAPLDATAKRRWTQAVETIGAGLSERFKLDCLWSSLQREGVSEIVLIPYRALHQVPLHLLTDQDGRALCDTFAISYAPSLTILAACEDGPTTPIAHGLFAENPDESLVFAGLEVSLARRFVEAEKTLQGPACRADDVIAAMASSDLFHFSGHASSVPFDAMASSLHLGDRLLTVGEIAARADLSRCHIAILSGCETAQVALTPSADEYAGLPAAFLRAGVPTVVGTQWVVEDAAGPLFMQEFYRQLIKAKAAPGAAFSAALARLRTITAAGVLEQFAGDPDIDDPALQRLLLFARYRKNASEPLFHEPRYWAAFCLIGHA